MYCAIILLIVAVWIILVYNKALNWKTKVEDSLIQIDVQLKAKASKISKLVEVSKKSANFELEIYEKTLISTSQLLNAITVEDAVKIDNKLDENIDSIFLLVGNYPELKEDKAFRNLKKQIREIEIKIEMYRQFYNDTIMLNNKYMETFPNKIILKIFGFKEKQCLEVGVED